MIMQKSAFSICLTLFIIVYVWSISYCDVLIDYLPGNIFSVYTFTTEYKDHYEWWVVAYKLTETNSTGKSREAMNN